MAATYQQDVSRSFQTIKEMLRDRGVTGSTTIEGMTGEDALAASAGKMMFHIDDEGCGYRIIYDMNQKFKLQNVRKLLDPPVENINVYLVVVRDSTAPTPAAKKSIHDMGSDIQFFDVRVLQYNVSRHSMVPLHEPVRDEGEIDAVLKRYMLKSRFYLPLILASDPMASYLALKHGQLVRITRDSPSAGQHVLYRCCHRAP